MMFQMRANPRKATRFKQVSQNSPSNRVHHPNRKRLGLLVLPNNNLVNRLAAYRLEELTGEIVYKCRHKV